jgi:mono/diheme cytochrome c family protein
MKRLRWVLVAVLFVAAIGLLATALLLANARGFSARERPTALETWIARALRVAALPSDARARTNPVPNTPEVLTEARAHWADHCAICHANDGSGDVPIGNHTYPPAPDMRQAVTQRMSDGELFYIIQNGIRLSAMPAWGGDSDDDATDSWKLVYFIRHLPHLSASEKKEMEKLNPKGPDQLKEEEDETKFLRGEDLNDRPIKHHHQ